MSIKTSWLKFFVDYFLFFIGPFIFFIGPYRFFKGPFIFFIFFFKVLQKHCCFLPCFRQQLLPNPLLIFSGLILWKDLKKKNGWWWHWFCCSWLSSCLISNVLNLMKGLRKLLMVSMITFLMVIMGRHLIGTCNIGNGMNSKKDLGMFVIIFYQVVLYIKMFYCNHYTGNFLLCMVRYCVAFQITDQNKTFAIILQISFRVSSSCVDRQMAICNAWKVTMWTSVRLLPRVGHVVSCKGLFMIWGKVTLITLMGFLSNVIRYVDLHMVPVNWRIIALIALMRSYPSSRLDMFSKSIS